MSELVGKSAAAICQKIFRAGPCLQYIQMKMDTQVSHGSRYLYSHLTITCKVQVTTVVLLFSSSVAHHAVINQIFSHL